jgi:hypothetical protein
MVGDEIRAYHDGTSYSHGGRTPDGGPKTGGIGFATWQRDRFVGLKAGSSGGEVRLKAQPAGGELHLNANAAGGSLVVNLVSDGRTASSVPMSEDSLDHTVRLDGVAPSAQAGDAPVDVTVKLTNAELFSIWWE